MFSSLRARLWLSYALLIFAALTVTALVLILYLLRSPLAYRQTFARLKDIGTAIFAEHPNLANLPTQDQLAILEEYDAANDVRILLIGKGGVLIDTRNDLAPFVHLPGRLQSLLIGYRIRDENGQVWLYRPAALEGSRWLMLAVPRPRVPLFSLLREDIFLPFLWSGIAALLLSLLLAYGLARWIGTPLQRLVAVARQMPAGEAISISESGPAEVRELIRAFNAMSARLQASQKSQREFVANVSHELKTPLTSIQGFAQAIQDGTAGDAQARQQAAAIIQAEAGRMHRMVLDLLDLARLDAGTFDLQRAPVDLSAVLRGVVEKFAPQASAAGVTLTLEAGQLPPLTGDSDRLAQVFTNLVDNAIKYTAEGGQVSLRASQVDRQVCVEVSDTGCGVPVEALPHLFDRFYRADPSRQGGRKSGAGLGLAIAREIVLAHGGTISVRSAPSEGSTFTVCLPLSTPEASTLRRKK
jgi:two-component system OmpR family sensor kinase